MRPYYTSSIGQVAPPKGWCPRGGRAARQQAREASERRDLQPGDDTIALHYILYYAILYYIILYYTILSGYGI